MFETAYLKKLPVIFSLVFTKKGLHHPVRLLVADLALWKQDSSTKIFKEHFQMSQ